MISGSGPESVPGRIGERESKTIHAAKALAITLVVMGHYLPDASPEWWVVLRDAVYKFHMPVFFVLSGYLLRRSAQRRGGLRPGPLMLDKLRRLGLPFVSIAVLFFFVKLAASHVFALSNPPDAGSLLRIFISPMGSYMPLLWFIYSLLTMFAVFALIHGAYRNVAVLLGLSVLGCMVAPETRLFCLSATLRHLPFFLVGYLLAERGSLLGSFGAGRAAPWLGALGFAVLYASLGLLFPEEGARQGPLWRLAVLVLGMLGSAAVLGAASRMERLGGAVGNAVQAVGVYSMSIYLLHTLFESPVRLVAYQKLRIGPELFLPFAFAAVACGILFPLLLEKYALRRFAATRRLFLGLR